MDKREKVIQHKIQVYEKLKERLERHKERDNLGDKEIQMAEDKIKRLKEKKFKPKQSKKKKRRDK